MSKRSAELLINDILEAAAKIQKYTKKYSFQKFSADEKTIDAVIRNFEIIGEAANRLPESFRDKHGTTEWHRIIGFRNRIVHDYMGVDLNIVWDIMQDFLPDLIKQIKKIKKTF